MQRQRAPEPPERGGPPPVSRCCSTSSRREFVASGGEQRWLDGLQHVAQKALRPQRGEQAAGAPAVAAQQSHIERLARGRDNWSLGELLQALTPCWPTTTRSALSCSAVARWTRTAPPTRRRKVRRGSSQGAAERVRVRLRPAPSDGAPVRQLMQKNALPERGSAQSAGQLTPSRRDVIYEAVDSGGVVADRPAPRPPRHDIDRFVEDADFAYEDFSRRGEGSSVPTFRVQDYSWEDHGFSLVNRLYSDVGVLLDDKFRTAYQLTYQTMGSFRAVDTGLFRRAVWRYIQCLYGIR
ncbi:Sestrin-1 [Amphibalanus amphitrite]|uniref:Sestrin-1 n=1 Tax=Amphibalanus amphitrite TaxID=1232801 RepID=A0A6A4WYL3_AMPAM|nr:Sestrin-1 [Amphibalanus amphitrite]